MKPIRLKKDNVVHTVHTSPTRVRIVSGAGVNQTAANPSGFGWPTCWVCTEKAMQAAGQLSGEPKWVAVESYGIADKRKDEEDLRAECTHGNPGGRIYEETKVLSMPDKWSETKKRHKRASIVFFIPSSATPMGDNKVLL